MTRSVNTRVRKRPGVRRHAPVEDQWHLIRTTDVEIFADDPFEEPAPGAWAIEDLGQD